MGFFAGYDVVPTSSAAASSPNHEAAALDQSLRLLDDAELEMLGIRRPPGRSGSTYHETVTTTTTSSPSSSPSLSLFAPSRGSARINNNHEDEEEDREDLEDDLDDLEEVVDRIPVSGAKLYERNHEAANAVQHRLLESPTPSEVVRPATIGAEFRLSAGFFFFSFVNAKATDGIYCTATFFFFLSPKQPTPPKTSVEHEQQHDSDNSDDKPEAESDGKKMAVKNAIRSNNSEHNFVRNATLANAQHSSSDKSRQRDEEATDVVPEVGQDQREATTATETNTSTMGAVTVTQAVKVAEAAATEVTKPERTAQQATDADAHRTMTPQEQQRPQTSYGSSSNRPINVDSFNLLDDSVSVSNRSTGSKSSSSTTGNTAGKEDPPKQQKHHSNNIFASENFDEQIIFLNGGDLLEANSVEQYDLRQFGKVERDVNHEFMADEPVALPLRPIIRGPSDEHSSGEDNMVIVYAEQHETATLACEVDADITSSVWLKDGQMVHLMDNKKSRMSDADTVRFARESHGGITISNVMMEDDGVWQCEAENARGFFFNGRPIKLVVLDPPKEPYLLIDQRRLDAGNMFIPVKENSELTLACVSEGGNPKPVLSWEVLLSPGIDRHAQKVSNDVLELQEIKREKDKEPSYKINTGAISEAKLPAVFRVHHNARILCVMEHPTLKMRQNASILLDVQYTPSFAITRTPGFGYPLREGIEVSLKCDVDSNPPSPPLWQKDDGDTPVPQTGDGFLNFSSIRREHSGWYKCTSRHLNFQYSSIGYYLSVRYDSVDVTSEPVEQDLPLSSSSSSSSASSSATSAAAGGGGGGGGGVGGLPNGANNFKGGQMEVELGGSVTLQCPQGK
ncbi:conserved hypothetical protein [Culex quinquefasciatus]|uniref:Ig-like domain-containing protein n=1 Tax=Culex quinquefasciatus TaxID=7176 RepID=B0XDI1_CULQU|nr:conserved hypothetical protein [Culex quinquefasciatus]|eukprot:XP_001867703.1 conserved hypothetical protein [Culex quinquefasciatus]